jgi:hypothetical protein
MQNTKSPQHELLKSAIEATDAYLGIEKNAKKLGFSNAGMNAEFAYHLRRVYDTLTELGEFSKHEEYIKTHIQAMIDLTPETKGKEAVFNVLEPEAHQTTSNQADVGESRIPSFKTFIKEEKKNIEDETISDEEIANIVDELTWEDIVDLYDEEELIYDDSDDEEPEDEEDDGDLNEKISVQSRLKRRQAFARMRGKRNAARNIKLRRASSMDVLKKRANLSARRAVYKRFLRGRDKSTLSAAEKDRIETQVGRMKYMQQAIATKMLPKMRGIEQKRLANYRSKKSSAPRGTSSKAPGGTSSKRR